MVKETIEGGKIIRQGILSDTTATTYVQIGEDPETKKPIMRKIEVRNMISFRGSWPAPKTGENGQSADIAQLKPDEVVQTLGSDFKESLEKILGNIDELKEKYNLSPGQIAELKKQAISAVMEDIKSDIFTDRMLGKIQPEPPKPGQEGFFPSEQTPIPLEAIDPLRKNLLGQLEKLQKAAKQETIIAPAQLRPGDPESGLNTWREKAASSLRQASPKAQILG